jgi:energy-coupling factor transporter ATP-binding protein EcfA2
MYVSSLQIENLRCFKSAEIELQYPGRSQDEAALLPNVNLLLGINGSGKTTVLKAIALAVLRASPAFLLVGYGATRYVLDASQSEPLPSQLRQRRLQYQRVAGLFEDHLGLVPLTSWLPLVAHENPERFREIIDLPERDSPRGGAIPWGDGGG